jgi:peptidoglycan hydrolase CwlO-like protein
MPSGETVNIEERQTRLEQVMIALAEAQVKTEENMATLAKAQAKTEATVGQLTAQIRDLGLQWQGYLNTLPKH